MWLIRILKLVSGLFMMVLLLVFIYAFAIEPNWIEVKEQPVYISNLPAPFQGLRIIQLSDLHGKTFFRNEIASKVNRLKPDIVVVTGDLFGESKVTSVEYAENVLGGVQSKYGTFFVFGNNEFYSNKKELKEKLSEIGIKTLVNERFSLRIKGKSIDLIGIDDLYSLNSDLSKALAGVGPEPKILLAHTPEIIYDAAQKDIDLVLSGHTHGGQFAIPFINWRLANVSPGYEQYIMGLYRVGKTQIYVNRGLGEKYLPVRFLTRPEITVITLHG